MEHAGAGWKGQNTLRYHKYVVEDKGSLNDAVECSYGCLHGRWEGSIGGYSVA